MAKAKTKAAAGVAAKPNKPKRNMQAFQVVIDLPESMTPKKFAEFLTLILKRGDLSIDGSKVGVLARTAYVKHASKPAAG